MNHVLTFNKSLLAIRDAQQKFSMQIHQAQHNPLYNVQVAIELDPPLVNTTNPTAYGGRLSAPPPPQTPLCLGLCTHKDGTKANTENDNTQAQIFAHS